MAPGIPIRIVAIGQERIRDPVEIFEDARQQYPAWLREAAAEADVRRRLDRFARVPSPDSEAAWAARVSNRLAEASTLLQRDRAVARAYLRDWLRTLVKEKRDDLWLESLGRALVLAIEHVVAELR